MDDHDWPDPATIVAGRGDWIGPELQRALVDHPSDCVGTEYPHYVREVEGPEGPEPPSERHPAFYGCYDWHSAVHSHWALVRSLRLFEDHPAADAVAATVDDRLTSENVAGEVAHLEADEGFERPYGWAWLLRLAAELALWDDDRAADWRAALGPLEELIAERFRTAFLPLERPVRVGTHGNSAFALAGALDYARVTGDDALAAAVQETAQACFLDDEDYPIEYEPLGWDFVSPALTEADLLRRVLDEDAFADWLEGFLPGLTAAPGEVVPEPVEIAEEDGMALHLVGLNLSRAWCLAGVADALADDAATTALRDGAERHAEQGLQRAFTEDYAGAHWLSSFVLYLATRSDGGIAPA